MANKYYYYNYTLQAGFEPWISHNGKTASREARNVLHRLAMEAGPVPITIGR